MYTEENGPCTRQPEARTILKSGRRVKRWREEWVKEMQRSQALCTMSVKSTHHPSIMATRVETSRLSLGVPPDVKVGSAIGCLAVSESRPASVSHRMLR